MIYDWEFVHIMATLIYALVHAIIQEDEMMVIDEAGESEEEEEEEEPSSLAGPGGPGAPRSGDSRREPRERNASLLKPGISQKAAQQLMYRYG